MLVTVLLTLGVIFVNGWTDAPNAIAAAVVCNPGRTISPEELVRFCCQRMSSYKKPRYIAFLDQLPVNDVGKVQKSLLRDRWRTMFRPVPVASGAVPAESKQGR